MKAWTNDMLIDPIYLATNVHPNWRALTLSSIKMVRQTMRDGSWKAGCAAIIKGYQLDAARTRRKLAAARAAA